MSRFVTFIFRVSDILVISLYSIQHCKWSFLQNIVYNVLSDNKYCCYKKLLLKALSLREIWIWYESVENIFLLKFNEWITMHHHNPTYLWPLKHVNVIQDIVKFERDMLIGCWFMSPKFEILDPRWPPVTLKVVTVTDENSHVKIVSYLA